MPASFGSGENRILAIFAPSADDACFTEQKRLLVASRDGLTDRDMLVVAFVAGQDAAVLHGARSTNGLDGTVAALAGPSQSFAVALIGKDGREKQRWADPVAPGEIFALIDAMPMRRREMRERN